MNRNLSRVIASISAGLGVMVLCMVGRFVVVQSPSVLRNALYLNSRSLIPWIPAGLVAGWAIWLVGRSPRPGLLVLSVGGLAVAVLAWHVVQLPSVGEWLLPPATVK